MTINFAAFSNELEKIAVGKLPPLLSMGGLGGLTAIEGAGALDNKKSGKERLKDGASAGFTASILAGEAIHNKKLLKGLLTKRAAPMSAANMKMMQQHSTDAAFKAKGQAAPAAAPALRGQSQNFEAHQLGGGGPSLELASKSQQMAKKVAPAMPRPGAGAMAARPVVNAARPAAQAAGGVMARIGKVFGKG